MSTSGVNGNAVKFLSSKDLFMNINLVLIKYLSCARKNYSNQECKYCILYI